MLKKACDIKTVKIYGIWYAYATGNCFCHPEVSASQSKRDAICEVKRRWNRRLPGKELARKRWDHGFNKSLGFTYI